MSFRPCPAHGAVRPERFGTRCAGAENPLSKCFVSLQTIAVMDLP